MTQTVEDVVIAVNLFPALVTLPSSGQIDKARLAVANGELIVWINNNGTIEEYYRAPFVGGQGKASVGYRLQVPDGEVRAYSSGNCGCGSPLKNYNPWPNARRIQSPL